MSGFKKKPCFMSIRWIKFPCHFFLYCKSRLASAHRVQLPPAQRISEEGQQVKCILPVYHTVNDFIKQLFQDVYINIMYVSSSVVNDFPKSNIHLTKCKGVQNRDPHLSHVLFTCNTEELALLRCSPSYSKVNV